MSKNKTTPAPAVMPHKYTEKEFVERYQALCKETGFQIIFEPRWRQSQEPPNDYRLIIATGVAPLPKSEG